MRVGSPYSRCSHCHTPIVWLKTRSDKSLPVLRVDRNAETVKAEEIYDRIVHVPHFAKECKAGKCDVAPLAQTGVQKRHGLTGGRWPLRPRPGPA